MKNNPNPIYTLLINLFFSGMEYYGVPNRKSELTFMLHKPNTFNNNSYDIRKII